MPRRLASQQPGTVGIDNDSGPVQLEPKPKLSRQQYSERGYSKRHAQGSPITPPRRQTDGTEQQCQQGGDHAPRGYPCARHAHDSQHQCRQPKAGLDQVNTRGRHPVVANRVPADTPRPEYRRNREGQRGSACPRRVDFLGRPARQVSGSVAISLRLRSELGIGPLGGEISG